MCIKARNESIILVLIIITVGLAGLLLLQFSGRVQASGYTWIVNSASDSGNGTLRWCLTNAISGDVIIFDSVVFPPSSPVNILLTSELPHIIQENLTIDASGAGVILNGSETPADAICLFVDSGYNTIKGIQVLNFSGWGIWMTDNACNNTIGGDRTIGTAPSGEGNVISANGDGGSGGGIALSFSSNNIIIGNSITNNEIGIRLDYSSNNTIYSNYFVNNTQQFYINASNSTWDKSYSTGGNYWSDFLDADEKSGINQDQPNGDGIWDHPYVIDENNQDNYPIVTEFSSFLILGIFMAVTLLAAMIHRKKFLIES